MKIIFKSSYFQLLRATRYTTETGPLVEKTDAQMNSVEIFLAPVHGEMEEHLEDVKRISVDIPADYPKRNNCKER